MNAKTGRIAQELWDLIGRKHHDEEILMMANVIDSCVEDATEALTADNKAQRARIEDLEARRTVNLVLAEKLELQRDAALQRIGELEAKLAARPEPTHLSFEEMRTLMVDAINKLIAVAAVEAPTKWRPIDTVTDKNCPMFVLPRADSNGNRPRPFAWRWTPSGPDFPHVVMNDGEVRAVTHWMPMAEFPK